MIHARTIGALCTYTINIQGKQKRIGTFDANSKTLYLERTKSKHLHKQSNSYGINSEMLEAIALQCDVVVMTEKDGKNTYKYTLPFFELMRNRFFLHFKSQGYERQIFIKHSIFTQFKTN
jgi:hypothetical protein